MSAAEIVRDIRAGLRDVDRRIRGHPWLAELEGGRVSRGALAAFAAQQLRIIPSDLRSFEALLARSPEAPERPYLEGMVAGERAALEALGPFAAAVGASPDDEPIPSCQAYPAFVAQLCRDGSGAEVAGAFLVNLEAWGANCARMRDALCERYGLPGEAVRFFDLFASPPEGFAERSLEVIEAGLRAGVEPRRVARASRILQAGELLYWDGLPR